MPARKERPQGNACGVSVPPGLSSNVDIMQPPLELSLPFSPSRRYGNIPLFFLFLLQVAATTKSSSLSLSTRVLFRFTDSRAIPEIESLSLSLLFILATSSFYIYIIIET